MTNTTTCQDKKILPYIVMDVKGLVQDFIRAISKAWDYDILGVCYGKNLDRTVDSHPLHNRNGFITW